MQSTRDTSLLQKNHQLFVSRVVKTKCVWGLKSMEGWPFAWSNQIRDLKILPFWSDRERARRCARLEWAEYKPVAIQLDEFMKQWLPGLAEDGTLVGTNWSADLAGTEMDPQILFEELVEKLNAIRKTSIKTKSRKKRQNYSQTIGQKKNKIRLKKGHQPEAKSSDIKKSPCRKSKKTSSHSNTGV